MSAAAHSTRGARRGTAWLARTRPPGRRRSTHRAGPHPRAACALWAAPYRALRGLRGPKTRRSAGQECACRGGAQARSRPPGRPHGWIDRAWREGATAGRARAGGGGGRRGPAAPRPPCVYVYIVYIFNQFVFLKKNFFEKFASCAVQLQWWATVGGWRARDSEHSAAQHAPMGPW